MDLSYCETLSIILFGYSMLKTRVIAVLVVKNGWVVQSIGFGRYLPVGSLKISIEYLNQWGIDEIIILDIDATTEGRSPNFQQLKEVSVYSQTPVSIGGGISKIEDIESMIRHGADKVVINSIFLKNPSILKQGAQQYGKQCMVVSLDAMKSSTNNYVIYNKNCKLNEKRDLEYYVKLAEDHGAGEIFINSVDQDGKKSGYDLKLLEAVKKVTSIPVILCGGVGKTAHLIEGANAGADAVAAGNFFHFTELSVVAAKQKMIQAGINIRMDSYATYNKVQFDSRTDRPMRLSDAEYEKMRFDYIPEEII